LKKKIAIVTYNCWRQCSA